MNTQNTLTYKMKEGIPESIVIPTNFFNIGYTTHAKQRAIERGDKMMILPTCIKLTKKNLIEVYMSDNNKHIKKAVVSLPFNKAKKIVLVLQIVKRENKAIALTVYFKRK